MSDTSHTEPTGPGYEVSDAKVAPLLRWGAILAIITAASFALMMALVAFFTDEAKRTAKAPPPMMRSGVQIPPEPRLQVNPNQELGRIRAEESALLHGYGWVDRDDGVVRIPIERAIDLLVERGLPSREAKR